MENILHRIQQISDLEGISISKIEQIIGASKGVLYKAIQKNTDLQSKWLVMIVENFPQYNAEWLLTGKGEMMKESNSLSLNEPKTNYESLDPGYEAFLKYLQKEESTKKIIAILKKWKDAEKGKK